MEKQIFGLLGRLASMKQLKQIHGLITKTGHDNNTSVLRKLVLFSALSPSGGLEYARLLFEKCVMAAASAPDAFVCNTIIRAYSHSICPIEAIHLYNRMQQLKSAKPDHFTFPFVLKACARVAGEIEQGEHDDGFDLVLQNKGGELHCRIIQLGLDYDTFVLNALIFMYSRCGSIDLARRVFDKMSERTLVSWNTMIVAYNRSKDFDSANLLLQQIPAKNVVSWNSMITRCVECGEIEAARKLFDRMPETDTVSWNSMIAGYIQSKNYSKALELFQQMQFSGVRPTEVTITSILGACAETGALDTGSEIHEFLEQNETKIEGILGNALIDMYAKCGSLKLARRVFDRMDMKHVRCWNAMIVGLAVHGHCEEALELFSAMEKQIDKNRPNRVTFLGVLIACSHRGLVKEGRRFFRRMMEDYKIKPDIKHYGCMVDLLSRWGHLEEAHEIIKSMPIEANCILWRTLLGASRIHGNIQLAEEAIKRVSELEPLNDGDYVLLSNVYAEAGRWHDVAEVRTMMTDSRVPKKPGLSLIEV